MICPMCNKSHRTVVENMHTGEILKRCEKCYDCLMSQCKFKFITEQITLSDHDMSDMQQDA